MSIELKLEEVEHHVDGRGRSSEVKPIPRFSNLSFSPIVFDYLPSQDRIDSNLLIFFHGLGDTQIPFTRLGPSLKLPQTAILSLRAFERVPLLDEQAFQWWSSFDPLTGSTTISNPNPTLTLDRLMEILRTLTSPEIGWRPDSIHLFGYGQGGSCAVELGLRWSTTSHRDLPPDDHRSIPSNLASIVSISGPLVSLPTISIDRRSHTPVLLWLQKDEDPSGSSRRAFDRAFRSVQLHLTPHSSLTTRMPTSPSDWQPILRFWSQVLKIRHPWELDRSNDPTPTYKVRTT